MLQLYILLSYPFSEVEELQLEQKQFQSKYYARSSIATRKGQINKYLKFKDDFGGYYSSIPCNALHVALYATWLARTLKYSSIVNYLSALNYFFERKRSRSN